MCPSVCCVLWHTLQVGAWVSFSVMTQSLPGMHTTAHYLHITLSNSTACASVWWEMAVSREFHLTIMSSSLIFLPSGFLHNFGVRPDEHLGKREAQGLRQGVQGLSKAPNVNHPFDSIKQVSKKLLRTELCTFLEKNTGNKSNDILITN